MNMACLQFGMTPLEVLHGATANAALALGLGHERGRLSPGFRADFLCWDVASPAELAYWIGSYPKPRVFIAGEERVPASSMLQGPPLP
jgi:imidazolonepropionase